MSKDFSVPSEAVQRRSPGTLYGIGVGPGAPDLITLRAVSVLGTVPVILAAASPKNEQSLALSIARPYLSAHARIVRLDFPMTRDQSVLEQAWTENARTVAEVLLSGLDAAFLTLGDPLIYSTFGYLARTLRNMEPTLPISIVPGITSYQAAAARTGTVLCEGEENLLLLSGVNTSATLAKSLTLADSAVVLKAYRNRDGICEALEATGRSAEARFASKLGLEGEITANGLENIPESPHYLSLILVPPDRRNKQRAKPDES